MRRAWGEGCGNSLCKTFKQLKLLVYVSDQIYVAQR